MRRIIVAAITLMALCTAAFGNSVFWSNRVWFNSSTAGTGTLTVGAAVAGYATPANASVPDQSVVSYVIIDGTDFEVGRGTYTASGTTLSRDTVLLSMIGGTPGTSKKSCSGSETVYLTMAAQDIQQSILAPSASQSMLGGI